MKYPWLGKALASAKRRALREGDVARFFSSDVSYISKWKKGEGRSFFDQVLKIAEGLGVSLDYLLTEEPNWLHASERAGVGADLDRRSDAMLRVISALRLSS